MRLRIRNLRNKTQFDYRRIRESFLTIVQCWFDLWKRELYSRLLRFYFRLSFTLCLLNSFFFEFFSYDERRFWQKRKAIYVARWIFDYRRVCESLLIVVQHWFDLWKRELYFHLFKFHVHFRFTLCLLNILLESFNYDERRFWQNRKETFIVR